MKNIVSIVLVFFSISCYALERKELASVSMNEITSDTQAQAESGDDHLAVVWWVPAEYWESIFSRDANISPALREEMINVLNKYAVIGVVQADISSFGAFSFYSKERVLESLGVNYSSNGSVATLLPEENVSKDMLLLMEQMAPILKAALGEMGANFHFYIYSDRKPDGGRVLDPYKKGTLEVQLKNGDGQDLRVAFRAPLNALFVPRLCPNGEKAHVSWNFCPWSGKKL